jgi:preprotein translocase subunit Sec63
MSVVDMIVIAVCLAVGYKFVSSMMGKPTDPVSDESRREAPPLFPVRPPWHAVLGVAPDATHEQIVSAYRAQMSQYHPDKVANLGADIRALAEQRAKEINAAYAEATARTNER